LTRLAEGRSTHLEPSEIATETLRLFDEGSDPSIRQLAKELNVTPSAIYHHYESRAEIVQAAVELVWREILEDIFDRTGDPFTADPVDVLVAAGEAARSAFGRHYAIAPYMAATPASDELSAGTLAIVANVFERFGLKGQAAAEAFHAYSSFTFGTALFSANRIAANAELDIATIEPDRLERFRSEAHPEVAQLSSAETRSAIDSVMDISIVDPKRDEELFAEGLRKLIESMRP
jgi:AcrR family transcriptional regulator